jgi:hypothetical protein
MADENPGSFNFYLYKSGLFVTTMAQAIQHADQENKERIRKAFPQMVAAHECRSWDDVPFNFKPVYNSDAQEFLNDQGQWVKE